MREVKTAATRREPPPGVPAVFVQKEGCDEDSRLLSALSGLSLGLGAGGVRLGLSMGEGMGR